MLSGEEFGRTKQGVKNSYNVSVSINRMDWQRCRKNRELVEYYRGLIALRKQLPGLCDKSAQAGERLLVVRQLGTDAAAIWLDNGAGSKYRELLLAYNASGVPVTFLPPKGKWTVLADGESSLLWQQPQTISGEAVLAPMSAMILGKAKT